MSTPTPLPPPPRRVRGNLGGTGQFWFGRIFMLPHTLIGIGAFGYLIFLLLWVLVGSDIPGAVTGSHISHSRKGGIHYILEYRYQAGGQLKSGSGSVSQTVYERFQSLDESNPRVTVRYFALGGLEHAALHQGGSLWAEIGFLALWVAFWDSVVSVFVYQLWIQPLRRRQLYKHGEATSGTLLSKRVQTGKTSTYYVSYTFRDPLTGTSIEAETQVWSVDGWNGAVAGQEVTVLYARDNLKRSTVYEFGGYKVDSGDGAFEALKG